MGRVLKNPPPTADETLSLAGSPADAAVVGNKIAGVIEQISAVGRQVGGMCFNVLSMNGTNFTFKITANEDTTGQYYRRYFLVYVIDQSAGCFAFTLVWKGYNNDIVTHTLHGSGSATHSNGVISGKSDEGSWGDVFVFWSTPSITISE